MKERYQFLAFDMGAESGRAVLGTYSEGRIALEVLHRLATSLGADHAGCNSGTGKVRQGGPGTQATKKQQDDKIAQQDRPTK